MNKSQLRNTISDLEILTEKWVEFRRYFYSENVTSAMASEFNDIKSFITSSHREFLAVLEFDIEVAQTMLDSVGRISSPRGGESLTQASLNSLENDWNSAYLLIQETIGLLEYRLEVQSHYWNPGVIFSRLFKKKDTTSEPDFVKTYRAKQGKLKKTFPPILKLVLVVIGLGIVLTVLWNLGIIQDYLP